MLKALLIYALVIGGIAATAGLSGASHLTHHAIQQWEQQQQ